MAQVKVHPEGANVGAIIGLTSNGPELMVWRVPDDPTTAAAQSPWSEEWVVVLTAIDLPHKGLEALPLLGREPPGP